jgi:hypothetical protein
MIRMAPLLPLVLLACGSIATAAAPAPAPAETALEEMLVQGDREKLTAMRTELFRLEDAFYAKYNELNTDRQYDVVCTSKPPQGEMTKIRVRNCLPVFYRDASTREVAAGLDMYAAPPARMTITEQSDAFAKNMRDVVMKHPELRQSILRYSEAKTRYEKVRKAVLAGGTR